jgi:hypothetical protein
MRLGFSPEGPPPSLLKSFIEVCLFNQFLTAPLPRHGHLNVNPSTRFSFGYCCMTISSTKIGYKLKNMTLDSYTCENCILQKEETSEHLFLAATLRDGVG